MLELALEMEALHVKPYRTMYPAVRTGRADDNWHGVNWRGRPAQPPVGPAFHPLRNTALASSVTFCFVSCLGWFSFQRTRSCLQWTEGNLYDYE